MNSSKTGIILNNYTDVQKAINDFCTRVNVDPSNAPHGAFWNTLKYDEFTNGNVPGFNGVKILEIGSAENSNIIQILIGIGEMAENFGPMPPGVDIDEKATIIGELSSWIDRECPNDSAI